MNQVVDSWHPVGTAFLGMHTQSLALLPALMGMKSVTNCILLLVSLLCPPAPLVAGEEGSQSPREREVISACWDVLPRGCFELDSCARGQAGGRAASPGQCLDQREEHKAAR